MTPTLKASIVIPTYNRRDILARTLLTVFAQDFPADQYEVIVVVDGSTDGTVEMLQSLRPSCALRILEQPNQGQATARNVGVSASRGDVVLFLDDDILCDKSLLCSHLAAHSDSDFLLVFGPVFVAEESPRSLATDVMDEGTNRYLNRIVEAEPSWLDWAYVAPNSSLRRCVFLDSGGFDVSFARMREDADLGMRLWKIGVQFRFIPSAVTYQLYTKSIHQLVQDEANWLGRAEVLLSRKHPEYRPFSAVANLGRGPRWKSLVKKVVACLPFSPEPLLRPPFWVTERLRRIPPIRRAAFRILGARRWIVMFRSALREVGSWSALHQEFGKQLPVLLFHHVGPVEPGTYPSLSISPKQFEHQVRWMARHGYVGIRPSDWVAWCREGASLPDKPVLLTFDDAYADLADYAFPVLRRYGFGAAVFVVTGQIGGTNAWDEVRGSGTHRLMTAEQIRHWVAKGIEFGAHSRTHADLTTLSSTDLLEEVVGSGNYLANVLGTRVISFAYPYGSHNRAVRDCVEGAFDVAFTVEEGLNDLQTDLHILRRTMVQPGDSLIDLACRVRLGWDPVLRLRSRLVQAKRRMLGRDR